ncbi:DUF4232 domain-containing protein [Streptacidiphilus pinicola]|nr:DUF4232 domain-containing protein [Streptacidiphilus pinicola]
MHTTSRLSVTAATVLTAGLALTACGSSSSSSAAASASPVASGTSAAASPSADPTASSTTGGTTASAKHCTTADVKLTVQGPAGHASEQQPATATIRAVNTSGHSCSLTGYPGVRLADDQGKSSPIDALRHQGDPVAPVTLAPGAQATAQLLYSDVNGQGSASGRYVCAVTGSKVSIILPNTTTQVKVRVTGGVDKGTLNVCGTLNVDAFAGIQD